jgi:ABC-type Fe3+ transport system permease subunit
MYPVLEESFAMWKKTYKAYGINTGMQAFYVELNAVRKTLLNCFFMTLAFSIGDVSVPMLFANPQFRSLSVLLLDCLGSYQFEKASLTSLLLIISTQAALLMVWWGTKLNKSRDGNFNRIKTHA